MNAFHSRQVYFDLVVFHMFRTTYRIDVRRASPNQSQNAARTLRVLKEVVAEQVACMALLDS